MEIIGKVLGINTSDGLFNILVEDSAKNNIISNGKKNPRWKSVASIVLRLLCFPKNA